MEIAGGQENKFTKIVKRIWNGPYEEENEGADFSHMRQDRTDEMKMNSVENSQRGGRFGQPAENLGGRSFTPEHGNPENNEMELGVPADFAKNATVISKGTVIVGDIKSDSNIEMLGTVTGNISTTGNVKINGKQIGDVQGSNVDLFSCMVRGNMNAAEDINVDSDSVIVGDIKCGNLTIDGKLKGNIHVMGNVSCEGNATILGDISSTTITINSGAKLKGKVEISDGNVENIEIDEGQPGESPTA